MASKKALVLYGGKIAQLQAGDTLAGPVQTEEFINLTNDEASAISVGMAVYIDAPDGIKKAKADAGGTADVIGIVMQTSIASGSSGAIQTGGVITATTGQWDAVTGGTGGLVFNDEYWLDNVTAGHITNVAPTSGYITKVGRAISTTEMLIDIEDSIQL